MFESVARGAHGVVATKNHVVKEMADIIDSLSVIVLSESHNAEVVELLLGIRSLYKEHHRFSEA